MYRVIVDAVAVDAVGHLPIAALSAYAEVLATLEVSPSSGRPYVEAFPDRPMRQFVFGPDGQGLVTYLVVENEREVHVLLVDWIG